jgi:hypothetical protein
MLDANVSGYTETISGMRGLGDSERAEEVQDRLFVSFREQVEAVHYGVSFRRTVAGRMREIIAVTTAGVMCFDGFQQVVSTTIMQEEDALTNAPKRSGAKHVAGSQALRDVVGETLTHVVDQHVRVGMYRQALQCLRLTFRRGHHSGRVAGEAADTWIARTCAEELLAMNGAG